MKEISHFAFWAAIAIVLTCFEALAANPPQSARELCQMSRTDFKALAKLPESRIAFNNPGGFLNIGVCWWHSRLQRSSIYLAVFRPELPRATPEQVRKIFEAMKENSSVVEIPGFRNMKEFSTAYHDALVEDLSQWQIDDGITRADWIRGITGSANESESAIDEIFSEVKREVNDLNLIGYVKIKESGVGGHAWLVVDADFSRPVPAWSVIDSNHAVSTGTALMEKFAAGFLGMYYTFRAPDWYFSYQLQNADPESPIAQVPVKIQFTHSSGGGTEFIPYPERFSELEDISAALKQYCAPYGGALFHKKIR